MNLSTIEEQLKNWHGRRYGRVDIEVGPTVRKLGEEFGEFMEAVINGEPGPIAEEGADLLFLVCHLVREFCGAGALNEAAVAKLGVIYDRLQAKESAAALQGDGVIECPNCMGEGMTGAGVCSICHGEKKILPETLELLDDEILRPRLYSEEPEVRCFGKCDACQGRFRCLGAGVPIPLKVQTGGRLGAGGAS